MKRLAWAVSGVILIASAFTAHQIYPSQKWWMRTVYVWSWTELKTFGLDPCRSCPIPDRFK